MMKNYEMVVRSAEHVSLLTKVLMMFSRRRMEVVSVQSSDFSGGYQYRIVFRSGCGEAERLLQQVKRAVDILEVHLADHCLSEIPRKEPRTGRIVRASVA